MIKKLLTISALTVALGVNAQQLPNAGFETWQAGNPTSWGSADAAIAAFGVPGTTLESQTNQMHSGSSAALLETKFIAAAGQNFPGIISNGLVSISPTGNLVIGAQPYTQMPTALEYWYKFNQQGTDSAYVVAIFTKWNTSLNKRDTVGATGAIYNASVAAYTQASLPIQWTGAAAPDSLSLLIVSSIGTATLGTQFFIDDVFLVQPIGIKENVFANAYKLFPNPATTQFTVSVNNPEAEKVSIYDVTGRLVGTYEIENNKVIVTTENYSNGLYIYTVLGADKKVLHSSKFNVSK